MGTSSKNARVAFAVINIKIRCGYLDGYRIAEGKPRASYRNKGMYHDDQEEVE